MLDISRIPFLIFAFLLGCCFSSMTFAQVELSGKWEITAFVMDGKPMNPPSEQRGYIDFTQDGIAQILGETGDVLNEHRFAIDTSSSILQFFFGGILVMSGEISLEEKSILWDIGDSSLGGIGGMMLLEPVPGHEIHSIDLAALKEPIQILPPPAAFATAEDLLALETEDGFADLRKASKPENQENGDMATPGSEDSGKIEEAKEEETAQEQASMILQDSADDTTETVQSQRPDVQAPQPIDAKIAPTSIAREADPELELETRSMESSEDPVADLLKEMQMAAAEQEKEKEEDDEVQTEPIEDSHTEPDPIGESVVIPSSANQEPTLNIEVRESAEPDNSSKLKINSVPASRRPAPSWTSNACLYQVNLRQFTEAGNIVAFEDHLPRLKQLGVDIIWFLPLQPVGRQNRIGSMGSPYAISDYTAVNPDFGTQQELKTLISKIHDMGMYVVMDWVASHTSWDHTYTCENPDWYQIDHKGNFIPASKHRSDVISFNLRDEDLQSRIIDDMRYWLSDLDLDGFHCVQARKLPLDFWQECKYELSRVKPLFLFTSDEDQALHQSAFDMTGSTELFHVFNQIADGRSNAAALRKLILHQREWYHPADYRLNYITSNEANAKQGSLFQRMSQSHKTFAVLAATLPGMTMIYGGQEAALGKRLKTFDKDKIDWGSFALQKFYRKLNSLRKENPALWAGTEGGDFELIETNADHSVLAFTRTTVDNEMLVLINLSAHSIKASTLDASNNGLYQDYFQEREVQLNLDTGLYLRPWEYRVLTSTKKPVDEASFDK